MKLIDPFYQKIKPQIEFLSNEVIIAQAWKKTHSYMRTHNWYADTLALDVSALGLELNAGNWAKQIRDNNAKLYDMELILAAKSEEWIVDPEKGWIPKAAEGQKCDEPKEGNGESAPEATSSSEVKLCIKNKCLAENREQNPPLRPLAHLTVRDQTWATAAMLCLADIVESEQGDCRGNNPITLRDNKVYSYGNRLLCDWDDDYAWFRWGNSQTYRRFFTDYQGFLKRPVSIGREVVQKQDNSNHVYVVSLDLKKFYNNIDSDELIVRLKNLCSKHGYSECSEFWSAFKKITSWEWDGPSTKRADELGIELGGGLPQGLVASGFFANAYLINFDREVGTFIHKSIPESSGMILHDYCRYVDDLRLVVSFDSEGLYEGAVEQINNWISCLLANHAGQNLCLNELKTSITTLSDLDNSGSLSERVNQLQHDLSGPADRDLLDSSMGILEGFLSASTEILPSVSYEHDASLIRLAKFDHDVRPDTLKRFAANRLELIMRNKRKMTESLPRIVGVETTDNIDNESELVAKKLVWAWMKDPSLALVLRKAIEIYPSPTILEPALNAIYERCSFVENCRADVISAAMADYLLADMFRCCSDFHGYFQRIEYPKSSDPDGVLEVAAKFAKKAILSGAKLPAFVKRQALLLLAILQIPVPIDYEEPNKSETIQDSLHRILSGGQAPWHRQRFALYEVAAQISNNTDVVASQLLEAVRLQSIDEQDSLLDELAKRGGPFWASFWKGLFKSDLKRLVEQYRWAAPITPSSPKKRPQRLSTLLVSKENPFLHECALVKLALSLLNALVENEIDVSLSPSQIKISQVKNKQGVWFEWSEIWRPEAHIKSYKNVQNSSYDLRFEIPRWVRKNEDAQTLYWLGTILRASVVGTSDFTSNRWKSGNVCSYKGLRTGWYKRRMGMMHAPEALVGEYATLSRWSSELLMKCLQWPGFESTHVTHEDIGSFESIDGLRNVLRERLRQLDALYCRATELPALITTVKRPNGKKDELFRLVTVQSLMPKWSAFNGADPTLSTSDEKAINRDHLARVCNITYKTLRAKINTENSHDLEEYPCSDLIVFPELAVHPDDQDILKQLADKTRSIVFAGLIYMANGENLVNVARWFLPDYRETGRQWLIRDQGKGNPTLNEEALGVVGLRPCQHIIEIEGDTEGPFRLTGSICYDATDLKLASDLKGKADLFAIVAHNKDVTTFDAMASALHYHMYQHVVVVNKGEFGGSTTQAPYYQQYDRMISHAHGTGQMSINVSDLDLAAFKREGEGPKEVKAPPANTVT